MDSREAALKEAGDLMMPISEGRVTPEQLSDELGEVVDGKKPGRTSDDQITVYKSVGIAIQDMAVASPGLPEGQGGREGHRGRDDGLMPGTGRFSVGAKRF